MTGAGEGGRHGAPDDGPGGDEVRPGGRSGAPVDGPGGDEVRESGRHGAPDDGPGGDEVPAGAPIDGAGDQPAEPDGDPLGGLWDSDRPMSGPPPRPSRRARRAGPPGERPRRDPIRTAVRGLGQLLITAGVVVLLFVVYEIWVTNFFGEQKQAAATAALDKLWASESDVVTAGGPAVVTQSGGTVVVTAGGESGQPVDRQRHYQTTEGAGFAKMYVPSFGADFVLTIIEGTAQSDLYAGPGHYTLSQYPGERGNFAMAGHRVNKGAPFDDLGLLQSCDAIVVETVDRWYVYRVLPMADEVASWAGTTHPHCDGVGVQTGQYAGVYGREITTPGDIAQIYPVPHVNSLAIPDDAESLITLTTCHPKFSDAERMIIHGILVDSYVKSDGFLPPQLQETT